MSLWTFAPLVFLLSLPFGYWRASVKKFSRQWFLAAHLPALLAVALWVFWGPGWKLARCFAVAVAFLLGQFVGGKVRHMIQGRGPR
jgi:hypothetical protein